jgi:hypothetical protein
MLKGSPSAIFFIVPRKILRERVFGRRATVITSLKAPTAPIFSRTSIPAPAFYVMFGAAAGLLASLFLKEPARHPNVAMTETKTALN